MSDIFAPEAAPQSEAAPKPADRAQRRAAFGAALKRVPELVRSAQWSQTDKMFEVAQAMAEDIGTHDPGLAKRIAQSLPQGLKPLRLRAPDEGVEIETARHGLDDVVLPESVARECRAILAEHERREELAAFALEPRHKVLLCGPPGNGKTMLAEALARELNVAFLRVKYAGLINSHLGETAKCLSKVLQYASQGPCVLFFDEFDGIAAARNGTTQDVGEARRIVNQLLIEVERLPSHVVVVAATNAPDLLDTALERRFDFLIELAAATPDLARLCALRELAPERTPGHDVTHLAERVAACGVRNLHAVVQLCRRIRRDLVLAGGAGVDALLSQNAPAASSGSAS
ncbi:MAG: AAA family ATPase [Burkholderiales bacterium]|nr:AAA family ATPase [Burkholderiales bacterium]